MKNIAFIDCYGDLAERFTPEMQKFLPELKVIHSQTLNETDIIKRIGSHTNILVYMAFISEKVLNSCKSLKSIAYLSTGLKTHGDLEVAKNLGIKFESRLCPILGIKPARKMLMFLTKSSTKSDNQGDMFK